jgi:transcriptional regulator with XRE-family HTH domain
MELKTTKIVRIMRANSLEAKLKQIGAGLSELRKKKGYDTIRDFAKAYKLPEIQYWRIENGKTNLTLKSLTKLLKIHKMTLEDFFCSL